MTRGRPGGVASAQALTPQERKERASRAARAAHSTDALIRRLQGRKLTQEQVDALKEICE